MKKRILTILACVLLIATMLLAGCGLNKKTFETDKIRVRIKATYEEEYLNEEFTVNDFDYINIKKIEYNGWDEREDNGVLTVHLFWHGETQAVNAVDYCKTLEYVDSAYVIAIVYLC